jgi:pilus assembly protein CpaE
MAHDVIHFDNTLQAVFSICASPDVTAAASAACEDFAGSGFAGEFSDYFSAERKPQFPPSMKDATGSVALVDCDRDPELALGTMERLRLLSLRNLSVVAVATRLDAEYLLRAMRAGCNEFLTKPVDPSALKEALSRFANGYSAGAMRPENQGQVLSFFGAKGGVGTTTLAVHVAGSLVRRHRKRTLLIDHHHELGHVALYLGLKDGQYYFNELVRNADRLDADLLKGFVSRHPSGLEVIASPDGCALAHKSSPEEINFVLSFLRTQYDYVLIDSSMNYKDIVPALVQASDEFYLVSTPDVAALRDLARRVENISLTDTATSKLRIIINRSTSDDAVTPEQIEAAVRFPVWRAIPNNYADLVRAINAGEPINPQHRSSFAQQINRWSEQLVSPESTKSSPTRSTQKRFGFWRMKREKSS